MILFQLNSCVRNARSPLSALLALEFHVLALVVEHELLEALDLRGTRSTD